ncbi:DUF5597 domain-containing protein [Parvularcula maris]|uniref:DUF5597 domain-containing protein n=1 Tax=Parvularcula maris TaxID=2965077 RepID=A0A9X2LAR0_9PROT|nr:DUF5597 domain-containing protein [Parvularcula maris]MCQ8186116.1 DUF5597 domain-containing protein [Parvularcula maris]
MLWAVGALDAIGFAPFSIEDMAADHSLGEAYRLVASLEPLILEHQGTDTLHGLKPSVSYSSEVDTDPQTIELGGHTLTVSFVDPWASADAQDPAHHGLLLIQTGDEEFLAVGRGATITFSSEEGGSGIERADLGHIVEGEFEAVRRLNGDQTHQGRHVRLPPNGFSLQRVRLYKY